MVVLHMIEDGFLHGAVGATQPCAGLAGRFARSDVQGAVPLKNGKHMTAIDIQWLYHEAAQRYVDASS